MLDCDFISQTDDAHTSASGTIGSSINSSKGLSEPSSERLFGIPEVRRITGFGYATAARLMKESGCCFKTHNRLFVLESSFFDYLHSLEVTNPCSR